MERATQTPAPGGQCRADRRPERWEQRRRQGAARARVARDHHQQDGHADTGDPEDALERQRGRADREDHQGPQPPQRRQAPRQGAEDGPGDDRAAESAEDREQREGAEADDPAPEVGGPCARAHRQCRGAQIAAHAPAHDQIEGREPVGVPDVGRGHVHRSYRAALGPFQRRDEGGQRVGQGASATGGDQQGVGGAGRVDQQGTVDLPVQDPLTCRRPVGHRPRVQRLARQPLQPGHRLLGRRSWRDHPERYVPELRVVQRPHVRGDEEQLQGEHPDDEQDGPRGDPVPELVEEGPGGGLGRLCHVPTVGGGRRLRRWDGAEWLSYRSSKSGLWWRRGGCELMFEPSG
ncbi:hypothetical protein SAMN04487980_103458 [Streptomyces sp. cf124]|nr:hypothetical protein SAMN04487980_103458 [Streptomyces sp. cf124]